MSSAARWRYYMPGGRPSGWSVLRAPEGQDVHTVGRRELTLILRARNSRSGQVVLQHDRAHNAERMAARRLVGRGLLRDPNAMRMRDGSWLHFYNLTDAGRTSWLRVREEA